MSTEESRENLDYVMNTSYDSLIMDADRTIDEFIVFTKDDEVIEIEQGTGERSIFIDVMIEYFESIEEFERCQKLIELKQIIIENGN